MKTYDCWVTVHIGRIEAESMGVAEEWAVDEFVELFENVKAKIELETVDVKEVEP